MAVGNSFEKPSDAFIKLEPITSNTIAKDKYKYFIDFFFIHAKKQKTESALLDKNENDFFCIGFSNLKVQIILGFFALNKQINQIDVLLFNRSPFDF